MRNFELEELTHLEALNTLCGEKLGEGSTRMVFRNGFDRTKVIKIATNTKGIQANFEEFSTWESIMEVTKINSYFAKVFEISAHGTILVQEYIPNIPPGKYKLPTFFTDLKPENYGLVVGTKQSQIVCRDYGLNLVREKGMTLKLRNFDVE